MTKTLPLSYGFALSSAAATVSRRLLPQLLPLALIVFISAAILGTGEVTLLLLDGAEAATAAAAFTFPASVRRPQRQSSPPSSRRPRLLRSSPPLSLIPTVEQPFPFPTATTTTTTTTTPSQQSSGTVAVSASWRLYSISSSSSGSGGSSSSKNDGQDRDEEADDSAGADEDAWDANVDYDKEWPTTNESTSTSTSSLSSSLPDPATAWDSLPSMPSSSGGGMDDDGKTALQQLGIGLTLEPLTPDQLDEIQKDAKNIIDRAIQEGVDDIARLRVKMNRELEASRRALNLASDLEARRQQDLLLDKIDKLTGSFLDSTESTRKTTKMAAAASRAMEGTGRGVELGTWGVLGGRTVVADGTGAGSGGAAGGAATLLGSVENARRRQQEGGTVTTSDAAVVASQDDATVTAAAAENRILIVADTKQDALARQLIPAFMAQLDAEKAANLLPADLVVDVLAPTATMPIGANNAACVVLFLPSLTAGPSSLNAMLDRLLRKTLQAGTGQVGRPPTQLVVVSTHGTERYEKFPYSMQNLMGGGKLEQRRQLEEAVVNTVRNRATEPALDYTILKVVAGDKLAKPSASATTVFSLKPGDVLDGPTTVETAAQSLVQVLAFQPAARNATLCIEGGLPEFVLAAADPTGEDTADAAAVVEEFWQETFLCLEGPEVWRSTVYDGGEASPEAVQVYYDQLLEYMQEWADLLATSRKGLTTPVLADRGLPPSPIGGGSRAVIRQDGVQLLFLPTNTGRNYVSRDEEVQRDRERGLGGSSNGSTGPPPPRRRMAREGGIAVVVELVQKHDGPGSAGGGRQLRVRARRCNYADDAVIKELSETTIVKRLQDALEVWKKDHAS